MRTVALFRFCLAKKFVVRGFDRYGFIELRVNDDPAVRRKFGLNSIWMEPQFLELISKSRRAITRGKDGLGWKVDFLDCEREVENIERAVKKIRRGKG